MENDLRVILGQERRLIVEAVMALERALWRAVGEGTCRFSPEDSSTKRFQIEDGILAAALREELDSGGFRFEDDETAASLVKALTGNLPAVEGSAKATRIADSAAFVTVKQLRVS